MQKNDLVFTSSKRLIKNGALHYMSDTLTFGPDVCKGLIYKKANEVKLFQRNLFYKRYLIIDKALD